MRENLKAAAWTEFSTLSWAVLQQDRVKCVNTHTDTSRVETLDQVLSQRPKKITLNVKLICPCDESCQIFEYVVHKNCWLL
jgi:hypothetical protein